MQWFHIVYKLLDDKIPTLSEKFSFTSHPVLNKQFFVMQIKKKLPSPRVEPRQESPRVESKIVIQNYVHPYT